MVGAKLRNPVHFLQTFLQDLTRKLCLIVTAPHQPILTAALGLVIYLDCSARSFLQETI